MKAVYTIDDLRDWSEPNLRYAVLGDPVAHSASPAMHNAVLENLGLPDRYCRLHIRSDQLVEAIKLLVTLNFRGVNLTIPHKTEILPLLDEIDAHSQQLGAVNTVAFRDGKLIGTNTDGPGIVQAIREDFGIELKDQRILILGAGGGAGRAISTQCFLENCRILVLANRTLEKIVTLARDLNATTTTLFSDTLQPQMRDIDLVINTSSVGMKLGDVSPLPSYLLNSDQYVYDTIYVGEKTPLQLEANVAGAQSANGLSLLLHQGVLALEFWLGQRIPVEVMRSGLQRYINTKE